MTPAVMEMIDELDKATEKISAAEDAELGEDLKPWDRAYAAERLRERKYSYSEEELKKYLADPMAHLAYSVQAYNDIIENVVDTNKVEKIEKIYNNKN